MATKKKAAEKFPETVFVTREQDGSETYLLLWESLADVPIDYRETVGVYRREAVGSISATFVKRS
jgi:hypothetical protein